MDKKLSVSKYIQYEFQLKDRTRIISSYCSLCVSDSSLKMLHKVKKNKINSKTKCFVCGFNILDFYNKLEYVNNICSKEKWKKALHR